MGARAGFRFCMPGLPWQARARAFRPHGQDTATPEGVQPGKATPVLSETVLEQGLVSCVPVLHHDGHRGVGDGPAGHLARKPVGGAVVVFLMIGSLPAGCPVAVSAAKSAVLGSALGTGAAGSASRQVATRTGAPPARA